MDKVKAVLKQKFWILLVVALIVPIVGWVMARSGLVAEAKTRTEKLEKLKKGLTAGAEDPNADWKNGVAAVNAIQRSQVRSAWSELYERQKELMTWPRNIPDDLTKLEPHLLQLYMKRYPEEIERVRQIAKPLDEYGENGVLDLADDLMPHPEDEWLADNRAPTAKEVEAAQEDAWLLAALLDAIAQVNSDAAAQYNASIRQVTSLYLRGGSENSAGGGAEAGGMRPAAGDEDFSGVAKGRGGFGGASGRQTGQPFSGDASFNPDDEFGLEMPDAEAAAAEGETQEALPPGDESFGPGNRMGGAMNVKMGRYVQDKPEWRTRGFYLEVVMDHRKVPELLVALANSAWPIRVTRVHQADTMDEDLVTEESGRGPGGTMGGMNQMRGNRAGGGNARMSSMRRGAGVSNIVDGDEEDRGGGGRKGRGAPLRSPSAANRPPQTAGAGGQSTAALDDHNLANVAIDGLITIFKKPSEVEAAPTDGEQDPQASQDDPADSPAEEQAMEEPAEEATAESAEESASDAKPEAEQSVPAGEADDESSDKPPAAESSAGDSSAPTEEDGS